MNWTTEKPKKEGFYFLKLPNIIILGTVFEEDSGELMFYSFTKTALVETIGGKWARIPLPEEHEALIEQVRKEEREMSFQKSA